TSGSAVAAKTMLERRSDETRRFVREAQMLSDLHHPGIVRYVADGISGVGEPYLVMEWLEGEDLSQHLERGPLDLRDACTLVSQTANALAAAHDRGIVHRDLKPSNLLLVDGSIERVKVLDFGIARIIGARALTRSGIALGTPAYM